MTDSKQPFTTTYTISISDINYGNHMGNDRFLSLAHEVRLRYLSSLGQSELDFYGTQLILSEAHLKFKRQVYHGDELNISVKVTEKKQVSFTISYTVTRLNKESSDSELVATITTKMACFDYANQTLTKLPETCIL